MIEANPGKFYWKLKRVERERKLCGLFLTLGFVACVSFVGVKTWENRRYYNGRGARSKTDKKQKLPSFWRNYKHMNIVSVSVLSIRTEYFDTDLILRTVLDCFEITPLYIYILVLNNKTLLLIAILKPNFINAISSFNECNIVF